MAFKGFDLTGKVAVVVGGTSGIGRAITCGLAEAGADIVPTSRRREEVEATAVDVESRGRKAVRVTSDVTDLASLEAALAATLKAAGESGHPRQLRGPHQATAHPRGVRGGLERDPRHEPHGHASAPAGSSAAHMLERGSGRIVNIASLSTFVGPLRGRRLLGEQGRGGVPHQVARPRMGPARRERQRDRARSVPALRSTSPFWKARARGQEFLTRTPLKRFGRTEELAGAAVFLSSDAASFVNGEVVSVDGGFLASGVNQ